MYNTTDAHHTNNNSSNSSNNLHNSNSTLPQNGRVSRQPAPQMSKEPVTVIGVPSVSIQNHRLVVGNAETSSARSWTSLKVLGDGSFGTVWLCDWHGTLPPNTPLSPMQCGGTRPEWTGKRLVAVKRMKKWEGGWEECIKLKELESLRAIPFHPNIIPLYDFFLLPASKELYFVFESMEGNLYHLIRTRKGRELAGGLVSSIFQQMTAGLAHMHASGYFHRDMKPENVLVTTTGLFEYQSVNPPTGSGPPLSQKDVMVIVKLADFGLARETKSKPPYTEYVSTRWYRAPEVLLNSRDYSNPVDMWALGTIMAELVNLRPLFPGSGQIDQMARICEVLGDPTDEYGYDSSGQPVGGGKWVNGVKLAKAAGFAFPKRPPVDIYSLFDRNVPLSLIRCIRDLLKYDPDVRLTSRQCLEHPYLIETMPLNDIPIPSSHRTPAPPSSKPQTKQTSTDARRDTVRPQPAGRKEIYHHPELPEASTTHRTSFFSPPAASQHSNGVLGDSRGWQVQQSDDPMEVTPPEPNCPRPMDIQAPPMPPPSYLIRSDASNLAPAQSHKLGKLGSFTNFGKKTGKWGLGGMFGHGDKHIGLPPVDEISVVASTSTPSLKRTQSSSTDSREMSPIDPHLRAMDLKKLNKKEAERIQRDAELQRRALSEKMNREQARAVMEKRNQIMERTQTDLEWTSSYKGKETEVGLVRQRQPTTANTLSSSTVGAAAGRFAPQNESASSNIGDWRRESERMPKARRREYDDDHSMSSSDVHSVGRMSAISFATVDSDPGPPRIRNRPSLFGISRMTSTSSLRTSFDDFSAASRRSSNSFSIESQLASDFRTRASVGADSAMSGSVSPPPMHSLSLSSSPSISPSPPWIHPQHNEVKLSPRRADRPAYVSMPPPIPTHPAYHPPGPHSPYEVNGHAHPPSPYRPDSKPIINPIFEVQPPPPRLSDENPSPLSLPSFAHLQAVAEGEYPPLSPMALDRP